MKTTIDIPEPLYRQAKIRAVEKGTSLKALVLNALEQELRDEKGTKDEPKVPYFARRQLLPEYKALLKTGAFKGGTNSAKIISKDRSAR